MLFVNFLVNQDQLVGPLMPSVLDFGSQGSLLLLHLFFTVCVLIADRPDISHTSRGSPEMFDFTNASTFWVFRNSFWQIFSNLPKYRYLNYLCSVIHTIQNPKRLNHLNFSCYAFDMFKIWTHLNRSC